MFSWHSIPFARILLPYVLGILLAIYQSWLHNTCIAVFATGLSCLVVYTFLKPEGRLKLHFTSGVCVSVCIACCAFTRTYFFHELRQSNHYSAIAHQGLLCVRVDDAVVEKQKYYRCYAVAETVCGPAGKYHRCQGKLLLYIRKDDHTSKPLVGDRLLIKPNISPIVEPLNPGEFDYRKYLAQRNIFHQAFVDSKTFVASLPPQAGIYRSACKFRDVCLGIIKHHIPSRKEAGVAEALLLGYKDDLDPDITSAFARTGTLHVLAVSGMHAGIIFLIISSLTRSWTSRKHGRWLQLLLVLLGLWFYAFITGLSSSVLRATVMFSIISTGRALRYKPNIYNVIYASAFLLLLYDPLFIMDVGFQLSYIAVLGIVLIQPMISRCYEPGNRIAAHCWGLISVSLAAQILTFPLSIFYFNQFPNYFLLSNFIIIPLTSLALFGLIFLVSFHWVPFAGAIAGKLLYMLIMISGRIVEWIDALPFSYAAGLYISLAEMCILYAFIFLALAFIIHKSSRIMICMLCTILILTSIHAINSHRQNRQHKMVIHAIKGHDVFSCIAGKRAYIISDEDFIKDKTLQHYHIEPWLFENGVNQITMINSQKDFISPEIVVSGRIGYHFFDSFVTMQNSVHNSVQKHQIVVLDHFDKNLISFLKRLGNPLIISNKLSFTKRSKLARKYFELFGDSLKLNSKAIVFYD